MRILALDLATKTGWALWDGARIESGVQDFTKQRGESNGMLFHKFNVWLDRMARDDDGNPLIDICVFEQAHHRGGAATEIAVGLMTRVLEACEVHRIEHTSVHSMTLKKWSTGSGKADKKLMFAAATGTLRGWGERIPPMAARGAYLQIHDDNEADAVQLLAYALKNFGGENPCNARPAAADAPESMEPKPLAR